MTPGWRKSIRALAVLSVCAVAVFLVFGERFLRLRTDRKDGRTDAVIALAGAPAEDQRRINAAIELWRQKKATYLILPIRHPAFSWSWAVRNYNLPSHIPEHRILIGRSGKSGEAALERYGGTFAEAQKTVEFMHLHGLQSAVVVSSGYHMRRVALAFANNGKTTGLKFSYHPVGTSDPMWWTSRRKLRRILREYQKLIVAFFLYPS
ncbi:MAG: hypothetical protein AMJ54_08630 [Deltaproteobacteria bacterium SG8_13]|nr:MAG: hypothetical protein AMJ54_08630 [Deltaproteobacteria bacterium SG8_13]